MGGIGQCAPGIIRSPLEDEQRRPDLKPTALIRMSMGIKRIPIGTGLIFFGVEQNW